MWVVSLTLPPLYRPGVRGCSAPLADRDPLEQTYILLLLEIK